MNYFIADLIKNMLILPVELIRASHMKNSNFQWLLYKHYQDHRSDHLNQRHNTELKVADARELNF